MSRRFRLSTKSIEWLTHHVALARQQQVDDAERVLGSQRIHQAGADFGRAGRTAIVAGDDLADGEPAGAEQRDDGDQPADHLALAALAMSTGRHHGGCRLAVLWDERSPVELRRTGWLRGRERRAVPDSDGGARAGPLTGGVSGRGGSNELPSSLVSTQDAFRRNLSTTVSARIGRPEHLNFRHLRATYPVLMRILMSGGSGLIGTAVGSRLEAEGHSVTRLVRRHAKAGEVTWDPGRRHARSCGVRRLRRGDQPVGCQHRRQAMDRPTTKPNWCRADCWRPSCWPTRWPISITSRRSFSRARQSVGTAIAATNGSTSSRLRGTTSSATSASSGRRRRRLPRRPCIRTVHLRTGIVLSAKGGALKKQLPLFKLGLGGRFGNGHQWQSWISIDDEVGAIVHLLSSEICGAVNLTAPNPVTNIEFTATLAKVLHRPAVLPVPTFGPKLLLGQRTGRFAAARRSTRAADRVAAQWLRVPARDAGRRVARRVASLVTVTDRRCRPPPNGRALHRDRGVRWTVRLASSPSEPPTSPRTRCRRDRPRTGSC